MEPNRRLFGLKSTLSKQLFHHNETLLNKKYIVSYLLELIWLCAIICITFNILVQVHGQLVLTDVCTIMGIHV